MSDRTRKLAQRYLKACSDPDAQFKVYRLWKLLDDVDTAADIAKSDNGLFRALVEQYQRQRFDVVGEPEIDDLYAKYDIAPPLHTQAEAELSRQQDPYYQAVHVAATKGKKKEVTNAEGEKVTIYQYTERQVANRHREKSERLDKLQKNIGDLESKLKDDLGSDDAQTRLTALAVALINHTYERVGNEESAADGHFGVTGWLKKHVSFSGGDAKLSYVGKSGVKQNKAVTDPDLVAALKDLCEGKSDDDPLFDCDDCTVTSKEVNAYLKPFDVTAKDLRGYHANREMMERLADIRADGPDLPRDRKERDEILKAEFKKALAATAQVVGHEAATLRSQYLVPHLEDTYMKDGSVIDSLRKKKSSLRTASNALERFVQATKTRAEREDEQVKDKLVRRSPKLKPPRQDLRDHRIDTDEDPDMETQGQEGDRDLSLNYKRVANLWLSLEGLPLSQRVAMRYLYAEESNVPSVEEQPAGSVVTTSEGKLRAKNKSDIVKYFENSESEQAKSFSEGSETEGDEEIPSAGEQYSKLSPEQQEAIVNHPATKKVRESFATALNWNGTAEQAAAISGALMQIANDLPEAKKDAMALIEGMRNAGGGNISSIQQWQEEIGPVLDQAKAKMMRHLIKATAPAQPAQPAPAPAPAQPAPAPAPAQPAPAKATEDADAKKQKFDTALADLGMDKEQYDAVTSKLKIPEDQAADFAADFAAKVKSLRDNPQPNETALQMRGKVDPKASPEAQAEQLAINQYTDEYILNPARIGGGFAKKGPIPPAEMKEYGAKVYSDLAKLTPAEVNIVLGKAQSVIDNADPEKAETPAVQQARKMMTAGYLAYLKGGGDPDGKDLPKAVADVKNSLPSNLANLASKMGEKGLPPEDLMNLADGDILDSKTTESMKKVYDLMSASEAAEFHSKTNPELAQMYRDLANMPPEQAAMYKAAYDSAAKFLDGMASREVKRSMAAKAKTAPKSRRRREDDPKTSAEVGQYADDMMRELTIEAVKAMKAATKEGENPPDVRSFMFPKAADRLALLRKQMVEDGVYPNSENVRRLDELVNTLRLAHDVGDYDLFDNVQRVGPSQQGQARKPRKVTEPEDSDAAVELDQRKPGEVWKTNKGADLYEQYGALSKDGETYDYFNTQEDAQAWVKST